MKKIKAVFLFLVALPLLALLAGGCFAAGKYFFWEYECSSAFLYFANFIMILGSGIMFYFARQEVLRRGLWTAFAATIGLLSVAHLILLYYLSNSGF